MLDNAGYLSTKKHKKNTETFVCEKCDFSTSHSGLWKRHLQTKKHNAGQMLDDAGCLDTKKHERCWQCDCGRTYKHNQSYYRHKATCTYEPNASAVTSQPSGQIIDQTFVTKIVEELAKAMNGQGTLHHNQMMEVIQRVGNNNHVNSHNQQFNISLYLNEQCKDAMSIQAFANSLVERITAASDQISGDPQRIVALIKDQVKDHAQRERPVHVHDKKWYIKDEQAGWEDDVDGKAIDVVNQVARRNELAKLDSMFPKWENGGKDAEGYVSAMQKSQAELSVKSKQKALKSLEDACVVDEEK